MSAGGRQRRVDERPVLASRGELAVRGADGRYDATGGRRACVAHTTLDEERGRYVHRKSRTRLTCRRLPHIEQFLDRHDLRRN